ncbi:MAG: anthranilate synthase component I family protein [Deltaproteobacteria bacterium]|nr:anthranilate synthase component I family protein [Deltaproteobacteria bacterium]
MNTATAHRVQGMCLKCAYRELPFELGEMPELDRALGPLGPIGFLESREGTEKWARYGIAAARPLFALEGSKNRYILRDLEGNVTEGSAEDPLVLLRSLEPNGYVPAGLSSFRYVGGWIGCLGYEAAERFEGIPRAEIDDLDLPDYAFFIPSILILKDAVQRRLVLVAWARDGERAEELITMARSLLPEHLEEPSEDPPETLLRIAESSCTKDRFLRDVARARNFINDGELIQVVLSRRWEVSPSPPPEDVYRSLSSLNPSPYHFYLRFQGGVLLGASPELLVRRENDTLTVRPIAGTRRRGSNREEDLAQAADLLADPKERAEHIMLVDLGRNDLGRVSASGSVEVTRRMEVESFSHVMHLVSEVRSYIATGKDSYDTLRATFPAGTVSGAPKVRAMQAISEMEPVVRGPYAGGVGYFDIRGNMDFCITIRSVFFSGERAFVQSGAGIVADSVPERECDEIQAKAEAMFQAFGNVEVLP